MQRWNHLAARRRRWALVCFALTLGTAACGSANDDGTTGATTTATNEQTVPASVAARVRKAVKARYEWSSYDIVVKFDDERSRGACMVYSAYQPDVLDQPAVQFAVLPDGRLAGDDPQSDAAAAAVLLGCDRGADADWWACHRDLQLGLARRADHERQPSAWAGCVGAVSRSSLRRRPSNRTARPTCGSSAATAKAVRTSR